MPFARLEQCRLYYEDVGQGETVVFLHAFSLDQRMWRAQVKYLGHRFRIILPDARGHGQSECPLSGYARADRVADLHQLVTHLGLEKFHLVGLSMGGSTALGYALKHEAKLRSLTLVSSGVAGRSASKKFDRLDQIAREISVEEARARWLRWSLAWYREHHQEVGAFVESMMAQYSGAVWRDPRRGQYPREDDMARVHELSLPTMILAGARDKIFRHIAQKLHEGIAGSSLRIFEDSGHMLNLEAEEEFNQHLLAFLQTVRPTATPQGSDTD